MLPVAKDPAGMVGNTEDLLEFWYGESGPGRAPRVWGLGGSPSFGVVSGCRGWLPGLLSLPCSERTHTSWAGYCRNEISMGRECNP